MFTLRGRSNLTCFNALPQKVVINYPLVGGKKYWQKKLKEAELCFWAQCMTHQTHSGNNETEDIICPQACVNKS